MISRKVILLISYFLFITVPSAVRRPPSAVRIRTLQSPYVLLRFQRQCNNNYYQIAEAKLGMSLQNNFNYNYDDQVTEKNLITGLKNVKQDKNWSGTTEFLREKLNEFTILLSLITKASL